MTWTWRGHDMGMAFTVHDLEMAWTWHGGDMGVAFTLHGCDMGMAVT